MLVNDERIRAARTMAEDARIFYGHGWLLGTSGNLSVRLTPGTRMLITASGKDKGQLTTDDFLVCDFEGRPVEETSHSTSAEILVHGAIYTRLSDVGAIYHVHDPYAALCSAIDAERGATTFEGLEMIKGLDIWEPDARVDVPIVPNHHDIPRLAAAVAAILDAEDFDAAVPGVCIHNHGIYAWGKTPFEAKRHIEAFAYLYRYRWEMARLSR